MPILTSKLIRLIHTVIAIKPDIKVDETHDVKPVQPIHRANIALGRKSGVMSDKILREVAEAATAMRQKEKIEPAVSSMFPVN